MKLLLNTVYKMLILNDESVNIEMYETIKLRFTHVFERNTIYGYSKLVTSDNLYYLYN